MKMLVTGAGGFIGRAFCHAAIERGHDLVLLTRGKTDLPAGAGQVIRGSLADTPWDEVGKADPDAAIHLAGLAEPGVYLNSPENFTWLRDSKEWIQRAREQGARYVAAAGTCLEYAPSPGKLVEDRSPVEKSSPYTTAKIELHEWLQEMMPGSFGWFRIFYVFGRGEHERRLPTSILKHVLQRRPITLNSPECVRDYVHVDDVARGLCIAVENAFQGVMNLGSGTGITIAELAQTAAMLAGADPSLVISRAPPLHDERPSIVADISRLSETGWVPRRGLREGLLDLLGSIQ